MGSAMQQTEPDRSNSIVTYMYRWIYSTLRVRIKRTVPIRVTFRARITAYGLVGRRHSPTGALAERQVESESSSPLGVVVRYILHPSLDSPVLTFQGCSSTEFVDDLILALAFGFCAITLENQGLSLSLPLSLLHYPLRRDCL